MIFRVFRRGILQLGESLSIPSNYDTYATHLLIMSFIHPSEFLELLLVHVKNVFLVLFVYSETNYTLLTI